MRFELPELPYPQDALAPHISARTVYYHYEKHHRGYLEKLEKALDGEQTGWSLERIIRQSEGSTYNFAAQVYNHDFYWSSLTPSAVRPPAELEPLIEQSYGDLETLKKAFLEQAAGEFGSGWAWLVADARGNLTTMSTTDADNPIPMDVTPLLTLDVWEHAYYLDYQNDRASYLQSCLDHLMNWEFAAENLDRARHAA